MALRFTQPVHRNEYQSRMFLGCKARLARKADNLTASGESTIVKMLDPRNLTTLWTSTACYGDSFTLIYVDYVRTSEETPMGLHGLLRGKLCFFM
jgi:hypothetical protein